MTVQTNPNSLAKNMHPVAWSDGAIELRLVNELRANPRNARTHNKAQLRKIARSLKEFGFVNPVLIDGGDQIIAGHGRVEAAKSLGWKQVPTLRVDHLNEAQCRAYCVTDNKNAEQAGWDKEMLRLELGELVVLNPEFDLTITGFEDAELDLILLGDADDADGPMPVDASPGDVVTRVGDVWQLGHHRLVCGDARNPDIVAACMNGATASVMFADPPYNVPIGSHVSPSGRHREFAMASGEMSANAFTGFLEEVFNTAAKLSAPGAVHFICMDWRHLDEVLAMGSAVYDEMLNLCVWDKGAGGMGSLYRSAHELVLVFRVKGGKHQNNVQLGRFGRNRTNVWRYRGALSIGSDVRDTLADHPTPKPVQMIADALLDVSTAGDHVLDPFGGSGSTLLAAERTDRIAHLVEIDPVFVDLIIRRWSEETGGEAILQSIGASFNKVRAERLNPEE
jgi:DNA modification methylase